MRFLLIFLMTAAAGLTFAQEKAMTLEEYRNAVLGYSFNIKSAEMSAEAANELSRAAYKAFLPTLSASGDFSLNFREEKAMRGSEMTRLQPYLFSLQPQIVQTIYGGGAVKNNYRQAEIRSQVASLAADYTILDVIYAAEYSYWNLAANKEYLDASQRYVDIIESLRVVIQERFDDGYIGKGDLLMMDVRLEEARYSLVSARQNYESALSNYNILMGQEATMPQQVTANLMLPDPNPMRVSLQTTLAQRPDFIAQTKQIELNEYALKLSRAPYNPQFSVGVSGLWRNDTPNYNGSTTVDGYAFAKLSVPIFSWGERRRNVAAAKYNVDKAMYDVDRMSEDIRNQESQAWIAITQYSQKVASSERSLKTGQENLDLSTYSYNEGQVSILEVMSAQVSWLQLYMNAITAGYNHRVAISKYRLATGELPN